MKKAAPLSRRHDTAKGKGGIRQGVRRHKEAAGHAVGAGIVVEPLQGLFRK